jgi:hypothetical protein
MNVATIVIIIIILCIISLAFGNYEPYNLGTIDQLTAKGAQDTYLTGDAWKYLYYPYSSYYPYNYSNYYPYDYLTYPSFYPYYYPYTSRPDRYYRERSYRDRKDGHRYHDHK